MNKKYITVDTGFCWLNVIELLSNDDIEITNELLEEIAPYLIKNGLGDFIKDDEIIEKYSIQSYQEGDLNK